LRIKDLQEDNFEKDKVALTEIDKNIKSNERFTLFLFILFRSTSLYGT
jgi:hypothetical protein